MHGVVDVVVLAYISGVHLAENLKLCGSLVCTVSQEPWSVLVAVRVHLARSPTNLFCT
jgi:hypothetical protein